MLDLQCYGWGIVVENVISTAVDGLSVKDSLSEKYRKNNIGFYTDSKQTINIENILLNRIEFLNVNLFEPDDQVVERMLRYTVTGLKREEIEDSEKAEIKEDIKKSYIFIFRKHFANIFIALYVIGIILFLVAGIIAAILSVIKATGIDKAYYKKISIEWLKAFVQMFLLIIYMVGVLQLNSAILSRCGKYVENLIANNQGGLTDFGENYTIFETLRTRSYSLKLSIGAPAVLMYIILVWYTIKFLIMYIRRLIIVYVYAIFGPIVMAANLIQKILTGKSKIQVTWVKEFTLNVLIQSLQAAIYVIFIPEIYNIATQTVAGFFLMFILIRFLFEFENILRQIFDLKSGARHSSLENVLTNTRITQFAAVSAIRPSGTVKKEVRNITKKVVKPIKSAIGTGVSAAVSLSYNTFQAGREALDKRREVNEQLREEGYNIRGDGARKAIASVSGRISDARKNFTEKVEARKKEKEKNELIDILKAKGSSEDEIALLMGKDKEYALTEEEKDKIRMFEGKMSRRKGEKLYNKKYGKTNIAKIKDIAKSLVDEKDGQKRISMGKLGFNSKTGKITMSNTVQERIKKGFMKSYNIKSEKEYDNIKKDMKTGLKTGVAISGAVLFAPIRAVDKGMESTYILSAIMSNLKLVEGKKKIIKKPVFKDGNMTFKNIKKEEKIYRRKIKQQTKIRKKEEKLESKQKAKKQIINQKPVAANMKIEKQKMDSKKPKNKNNYKASATGKKAKSTKRDQALGLDRNNKNFEDKDKKMKTKYKARGRKGGRAKNKKRSQDK